MRKPEHHHNHNHHLHHHHHHQYHRRWQWWCWIAPFLPILLPILTITLLLLFPHRSPNPPPPVNNPPPPPPPPPPTHSPPPTPPRLFYLISGTKEDGPRLKRILLATYHPNNLYLLHLDLAASFEERLDLMVFVGADLVMSDVGNVRVVEDSDHIVHDGPTIISSLLHAVAKMFKDGRSWDWFINLGPEDYPIMSQDGMLIDLCSSSSSSFLSSGHICRCSSCFLIPA